MTHNSNKQDGSEWLDIILGDRTEWLFVSAEAKERAYELILEHEQAAVVAARLDELEKFRFNWSSLLVAGPRRYVNNRIDEFKQGEVG